MDFTAEQLPDTLTVEHNGAQMPLREHAFVKEAPDLPTLIQRGYDAHREVGARVRIPGKDAKPEDVAAFKQKVQEAGVFPAPPASVDEYKAAIVKPEGVSDLGWSDERAGKLATVLHKHGIPASAVADLLALHGEALSSTQALFKSDMESGMAALRKEFPEDFDGKQAAAGRLAAAIFKTPEELAVWNASGLGNHPAFLGPLMRLAPLAAQDSSFFAETSKSRAAAGEDVRSEVAKIATDKTHPMHEGYVRRDPAVLKHIDDLYRNAFGSDPVEIGQGITVTGAPA